MPVQLDPAGVEPQAILAAADFSGARVLEIGAGDGRLTVRYAGRARSVVAFDQDVAAIAKASKRAGLEHIRFLSTSATTLPFHDSSFDLVLLACAL